MKGKTQHYIKSHWIDPDGRGGQCEGVGYERTGGTFHYYVHTSSLWTQLLWTLGWDGEDGRAVVPEFTLVKRSAIPAMRSWGRERWGNKSTSVDIVRHFLLFILANLVHHDPVVYNAIKMFKRSNLVTMCKHTILILRSICWGIDAILFLRPKLIFFYYEISIVLFQPFCASRPEQEIFY